MFNSIIKFLMLLSNFTLISNHANADILPESKLMNKPTSFISVKTDLGTLVGYRKKVQNRTINVFYGVPYAEKPIGKLRFRRSKLINRFPEEPYEALEFKAHCEQSRLKYNANDKFSEDCLYMNIFTPDLELHKVDGKCKKKFNSIAFIFGGENSIYRMSYLKAADGNGYLVFSGDLFAALHDTIFVTFNFRHQMFANLYAGNEFTGNLAFYDQNLALRWVKKYMKDLCGDDNLTVIGHSLGAKSVGFHLMSNYSKSLITNAILMSSAPLFQDFSPVTKNEMMINSFLVMHKLMCLNLTTENIANHIDLLEKKIRSKFFEFKYGKEILNEKALLQEAETNLYEFQFQLAKHANSLVNDRYIDEDVLKMIKFLIEHTVDFNCLENVPSEQVRNFTQRHNDALWAIYWDFDFIGKDAYLDYKLFNKIDLNPNVNILIGILSDEMASKRLKMNDGHSYDQFTPPVYTKDETKHKIMNEIIQKSTSRPSGHSGGKSFEERLAEFYTDETKWTLSEGYFEALSNYMGDRSFQCPSYFFANYVAMVANSTYAYVITQTPTKHFSLDLVDYDYHTAYWLADELIWMFGMPLVASNLFPDSDRSFSLKLLEYWTKFAREGRMPKQLPSNREWPNLNKIESKSKYVELNEFYIREREFEFEKRCEKWWRPLIPFYKR